VIGPDGEQVGILGIREALAYAQERQLDLVEVSPTARPPVCRVMDFGKYKYEQNKKQQKARKKQHVTHLKEVKLRPKIEEHDYAFKVNHGRRFLELHDKVKFTVTFRGREMAHTDAGYRLLEKVVKDLEEVGQVENPARLEGRNLVLLMVPRSAVVKPAAPATNTKPAGAVRTSEKKPAAAAVKQSSTPSATAKPTAPRS
jgi:translation initiation factor IF-3